MTATPARVDESLPFPGATGRGIKIAVVDSGVNAGHPHICAPIHGVAFGEGKSWDDELGHGTAVTAAIQEKAPCAEYYILKLFGASLRTTTRHLIQAIEWSIENRMDLVNLSLGTPNLDHKAELQALVERATAHGTILVSARCAGTHPVLPGAIRGVAAVDVDWNLPRHRYRSAEIDGRPCFFASGFPRSLPGMAPARNLNGISFAVANMTGFIARACEGLTTRSFDELRRVLEAESA